METLTIDIIDPKAKKMLEDMEDMNLISINNNKAVERLERLLGKIRSVGGTKPTLEEITKEVELIRLQRYEQ
ncbi:MAG: hypothetical protein H0X70_09145 [Segetibacter sp.]|nr:hypothetical protein [Segetibacter sp.]